MNPLNMTKEEIFKALNTFNTKAPLDWDKKKDRDYYTEWYGPEAGCDHALEKIIESRASLNSGVRHAIGFLHGGINRDVLEVVDALSFPQRIEVLRLLILRVPPPTKEVERFMQDLANCLTVEAQQNEILSAYMATPKNSVWLRELQTLSDCLFAVDNNLRESMGAEYEKYDVYAPPLSY
jgi:hypothetical protein